MSNDKQIFLTLIKNKKLREKKDVAENRQVFHTTANGIEKNGPLDEDDSR